MRICIDLDGTICTMNKIAEGKYEYETVVPLPGAVERLQRYKAEGHYIIILTARHMHSTNGNTHMAIQALYAQTQQWLERHNIPYDELIFGKPFAHVYIDDKALLFTEWDKIDLTPYQ